MGEAIIARAGGESGRSNGVKWVWKLKTEVITENTKYTVPSQIRNDEISVMIFGGGGGGYNNPMKGSGPWGFGGGAGGCMNKDIITVASGSVINIVIGNGGEYNNAGETTFFGNYLSANGGGAGPRGNGGSGGGGGGTGFQFGGGGITETYGCSHGGNGGKWGGAGGSAIAVSWYNNQAISNENIISSLKQSAGCGISGYITGVNLPNMNSGKAYYYGYNDSTNGVNRYNNTNDIIKFGIDIENIPTNAIAGKSIKTNNGVSSGIAIGFGGGGGWGGNGGSGDAKYINIYSIIAVGGGGGGCYCNGGNSYIGNTYDYSYYGIQGGGGGYGDDGDDGYADNYHLYIGAGGGYGSAKYAHGGGGHYSNLIGNSGICILQYYQLTAT